MSAAGRAPASLLSTDWRLVVLAGASAGLVGASLAGPLRLPAGWPLLSALAGLSLALVRPHGSVGARAPWLAAVGAVALLGGLALGADRIAAIDRGAAASAAGREVSTRGFVASVPRRSRGGVSFRIDSDAGRLLVGSEVELPELPVGREVAVEGTVGPPEPWRAASLRRHGVVAVLEAERVQLTGGRRGGVAGRLDRVRDRAEAALERGMAPPEAALARGFVLGQDDRIDPRTVEDFKRSGLAHLLAVSGQNVLLLALLAMPLLGALGLRLRARLVAVLLLIAVYVPVAGAGPSIQRAGVMGAAGIVATLAGRPGSRVYAVLMAGFVTLAANPRAGGDAGWQLSFAAVIGILLWAGPVRDAVLRRLEGDGGDVSIGRRTLAEGVAMTVSATIATAPLMALHFDAVPLAALPANLLALPAVAPVMWLGMTAAGAGQLSGFPVEPINAVNGVLIGYIAQIAHWLAAPDWALLAVPISGPVEVGLAYAAILAVGLLARSGALRRRGLVARRSLVGAVGVLAIAALSALPTPNGDRSERPPGTLQITIFDVGQGDAILIDPPLGEAILIDAGPPSAALVERLGDAGVERLAALVITHDQLDHSGGAPDVLDRIEVGALVHAAPAPSLARVATATALRRVRLGPGETLRSGRLRLEALWPPRSPIDARPPATQTGAGVAGDASAGAGIGSSSSTALREENRFSLVLLARWRGFSMLLTGDAEAEAAAIDPGPIDVLKVAHHGSEDSGLAGMLARSAPGAAVISVGSGNPHGHPAPATLGALSRAGVRTFRTDRHGDTRIVVGPERWEIRTESDG